MTDTSPRDLIQQLAGLARRKHYTCEDSWYNCPKSEDGSANDYAGTECDCGADEHNAKVDAICAYLSQPEPEGPTDEELLAAQDQAVASFPPIHPEAEPLSAVEYARELEIRKARAVLARWGRPVFRQKELTDEQLLKCFKIATPCYNMEDWRRELDGMRAAIAADRALCARLAVEPVPVNELVDLAHELRKTAEYLQGGCGWAKALDAIERAATLIESNALRLIAPTPVSERPWERDGWCDNNGWCWGFDADDTDPCWSFDKPEGCPTWTHLLPHNALPIPTPTA